VGPLPLRRWVHGQHDSLPGRA